MSWVLDFSVMLIQSVIAVSKELHPQRFGSEMKATYGQEKGLKVIGRASRVSRLVQEVISNL